MAEEVAVPVQTSTTIAPGIEVITPGANMFSDNAWSTDIPVVAQPPNPADGGSAAQAVDKPIEKPVEGGDEIVDELEYLEKQTGFKTWDEVKALKTEAEQLRQKTQTPAERKFANEESKRLAEAWEAGETDKVFDYLNTQRQLKKAGDMAAADAIKLHLQQTNPHFKPEDVEDVFEERYSVPKKPVQKTDEDVEDFNERMTEYSTRVAKVARAIERDGVTAKQDLAKRIAELVPPEIPKRVSEAKGPTQEELDGRKTFIDNFVKALPKELENFKGFTTTFKDEVVELPITYGVAPEEVKAYQTKLESLASVNLDTNSIFTQRWVNKDGTVNSGKAAAELYILDNWEKILQKVANESGTQRMNHQIKLNSNIKVDGKTPVATVVKTAKEVQADNIDFLWKA